MKDGLSLNLVSYSRPVTEQLFVPAKLFLANTAITGPNAQKNGGNGSLSPSVELWSFGMLLILTSH